MRQLRSISLLSAFALAAGACTDSPTTTARSATSARADVTCSGVVQLVQITGPSQVSVGQSINLQSSIYDTTGCPVTNSLGHTPTWSSSNTAVATISAPSFYGATLNGVAAGSVLVTLTVDGQSTNYSVTVANTPRLTTILVTPNPAQTTYGSVANFQAQGKDQFGNSFPVGTVTWSSSNTAVATVNSSGVATGTGRGTATITATSGSVTGSAPLTIIPSVATSAPDQLTGYQTYTVTSSVGPAGSYYYTWNERVCTNGGGCTAYQVIAQGTNLTSVQRSMTPYDVSRSVRLDIRDYQGGPVLNSGLSVTLGDGLPDTGGSCYPRLIC